MTRLTQRDNSLLTTLGDYEFLSTRQLLLLAFPKIRKTTALRRLRKLETERLIKRVHGLAGGEFVWCLSINGAHRIHRDGCIDRINRNSLEHDVLLNDLRMAFERIKLVTGWRTEQSIRRAASNKKSESREDLNPDAIASVRTANGVEAVAIELELFAKNSTRYRKTFRQYAYLKQLWAIWYLVPDIALGKRLAKEWTKATEGRGPQFYFLLVPEVLSPDAPITLHGISGNRIIQKSAHTPADTVSNPTTNLSNNSKQTASSTK